jgi:hypothetical protein
VLSNAGIKTDLSRKTRIGFIYKNMLSPELIYDTIVFGRVSTIRHKFEEIFDVLALPDSLFEGDLEAGDLLIRRHLGTSSGHIAFIAAPERWSYAQQY